MTEAFERGYTEGARRAWITMARHLLAGLDEPDVKTRTELVVQHQETIAALRNLCEDYGRFEDCEFTYSSNVETRGNDGTTGDD